MTANGRILRAEGTVPNVVVLVTRPWLGTVAEADRGFGAGMMEKFLHTLEASPSRPVALCFYTEGVRMVTRNSELVPGLQLLAGMGVRLVVCRTCLEYYGLLDEVAVGEIGGMNDIVALMMSADSVVTV